jgi:serine/threonine-protein kinase
MADAQRYQIQELIAAGGMAEVYLGESAGIEGFRKKVAIKRVLPKLSENQDFINMFLDEARLCAYLSHSKCVQVFDIGQGAGSHFIVMEYVDGADLRAVLDHLAGQGKALSVELSCLIAMQICEGLAYAHGACDHQGNPLQIVHRDISPHNVLMTRHGEVKLVDFGLAKASSHLSDEDEDIVKGKFGYLAPEVTLRMGADHRADIFAVGILLFEMLAGRRLFLGKTDLETFKQVQAAQIPDLRQIRPDVDELLGRVILKALARDRQQRYQSADDLARDLAAVLFAQKRPVTYQDIAKIVQAAASAQAKKRPAKDTRVMIGELILDALHGFSHEDELEELVAAPGQLQGPHAPLSARAAGGYEDPTAWGLDDLEVPSAGHRSPVAGKVRAVAPAAVKANVEVNLAAKAAPSPGNAAPERAHGAERAEKAVLPAPAVPAQSAAARARKQSVHDVPSGPWWKRWF